MATPQEILARMLAQDQFSQWMGIEILEHTISRTVVTMTVRAEMLNGFGIAHGAITFALADSALAFASNAEGKKALSIHTEIDHLAKVKEGDTLIASTERLSSSRKLAHYQIIITDQSEHRVAIFKGIVYKTNDWDLS